MADQQYTRDDARISVVIGGREFEGWLQSEVSRSLETICGTFSIPVSLIPGQWPAIKRQDEVQVRIGSTTVITGYVLAAEPFYRRNECGIRIQGRDRTGDLVRCSAVHAGGQWLKASLDRIARDLVAPFGLQVVVDADMGEPLHDFKLSHGESVLDAIARAARQRGVLPTRDDQGRLLLTKAGKRRFKGVIRRGWNVIEMQGIGSDEERHSHYIVYGQGNTAADFQAASAMKATATDAEIRRYLPLVINADGNVTQAELQALVTHTMRVRRGHSMGFRYLVEGWTFEGEPWPLNQRVTILDDVAGLDGEEWLISSVRHVCDLKDGDVTELTVVPIEAFDDLPVKTKATHRNWGGKASGGAEPRGPHDRARGGQ